MDIDSRSPKLKEFLNSLKEMEFKGYEYEAADASLKLLLNKYLKGEPKSIELVGYRVMAGSS